LPSWQAACFIFCAKLLPTTLPYRVSFCHGIQINPLFQDVAADVIFCFHFLGSIFHENHCANLKHQARQDDTILPNLKLPRVHGMCLFMVPQGESEARLKKNGCLVNQIVLQ
jgi:hypothetical protein